MKLVIEDVKKSECFQIIFQNIRTFSDKYCINFNPEHIYIQGMDDSHIAIFEVMLKKEWFKEYECETQFNIGIHGSIFSKILATRDPIQHIIMNCENDNPDNMDLSFMHPSNSFDKHFRMPLIDYESEMMSIPPCDYSVNMEIESKEWKKIVDQLSNFGDSIQFLCKEDSVHLIAGSIEGKMDINILSDKIETYEVDEGCDMNAQFQLRYLQTMANFQKVNKYVNIMMSEDIPCCCKFNMNEDNYIQFYLAPQIND